MTPITRQSLLDNGWKETGDHVIPCKKTLTDKGADDYDPDSGEIELVLHRWHNNDTFALSLPDGSMVNINPQNQEELNIFERLIISYEPNY